jgi:hypothetical protein
MTLSGINLTQWRDKSGNGYIMTNNQGTTTVATSSLNSLTTVYTPSGTNSKITNFVGRTKCTMFLVGKAAISRYLLALNGGFLYTANDSLLYFQPPTGTYLDLVDSVSGVVVSNNTWFILCIGYDNATNNTANPYTINGTTRTTIITPRGTPGILTDQNITSTLYINSVNGTNSYDSVYTAEILYYNNTLTTSQRQQIEGYLAWKWGLTASLPATHPYKTIPTALTVPLIVDPLSNFGSIDTFVVKYDSSGRPLWARRMGGTFIDQPNSVTVDSSGNIIVTGWYSSNPLNIYDTDGTTISFTLTSSGGAGIFLVEYNSSGRPLWARKLGGVDDNQARSVSVDSSGNIVIAGYYASNPLNIYAADGTTVSFTLANSGSNDAFVVKYNTNGTPLWARRLTGTVDDQVYTVSVDSSGNIVVAGLYSSNPLNIYAADGTTVSFTLANSGSYDSFLVEYDSSGTPLWARRVGGTGNDQGQSASVDSSGNIVFVGYYASNPLNIYASDGTTVSFTLTNAGSSDAFVVKYNTSGTPLWARRLGGTLFDIANSVTLDSSGNVIVAGYYSSSPLNIYASDGTTVSSTLTNSGSADVFVVKYDSSGTLLWARRIGGTSNDFSRSVTVDSSGNVIVTGFYSSSPLNVFAADGTTVFSTLTNSGGTDTFLVKYDSSGTPIWSKRIGGTGNDASRSVSVDSSGNIIVAGEYSSTSLSFYG